MLLPAETARRFNHAFADRNADPFAGEVRMTEEKMEQVLQRVKQMNGEEDSTKNLSNTDYANLIERGGVLTVYNAPGEAAVLTLAQHTAMLTACVTQSKHELITLLTPYLVFITEAVGSCFIHSGESAWIRPRDGNKDPNALQACDAFSCTLPLYEYKHPRRKTLRSLQNVGLHDRHDGDVFKFGQPIWKIRDHYVIWEFRWQITATDRGMAYSHLHMLSRGDCLANYWCFLCDSTRFLIITAKNGSVGGIVQSYSWTTAGSADGIQRVVRGVEARQQLLGNLCGDFTVTRFLGSGAFGRCFAVTDGHKTYALKVVQIAHRSDCKDSAMVKAIFDAEFNIMVALSNGATPLAAVMGVDPAVRSFVRNNIEIGRGYLMSHVGVSAVPPPGRFVTKANLNKLFRSLASIHQSGYIHGDARIQNAVLVEGAVKWIDFFPSGPVVDQLKGRDAEVLLSSITKHDPLVDTVLINLLNAYATSPSDANVLAIVQHVVDNCERIRF